MNKINIVTILLLSFSIFYSTISQAADIKYQRAVTLNVGQSIILKGVRANCDDTRAPSWSSLQFPQPKTGVLSNGGTGTVESDSCGKTVPARAVRFRATRPGKERLTIYGDRISITVN